MIQNEAKGRNFIVSPNGAQIFHASSRRQDNDTWRIRDPFIHDSEFEVDSHQFMLNIEDYLIAVERAGDMNRAKMLLIDPVATLVLHSLGVITAEHFRAVKERSSGYFDIPRTELSEDFPVRVAQHPGNFLIVVDDRGYPVSSC